MPDAKSRIEQLAAEFVAELQQIAREEVVRVLDGAPTGAPGRSRRTNGAGGKRSRGEKRSPKSLEQLQEKLLSFVKANPGLRIEQINAELGTSSRELALPVKKLVSEKQLRTTGTRRATKYFAGGRGGKTAKKARKMS
jgi:hypothetical protein